MKMALLAKAITTRKFAMTIWFFTTALIRSNFMWNLNKERGPQEIVKINPKTLETGPETIGTLVIRKVR